MVDLIERSGGTLSDRPEPNVLAVDRLQNSAHIRPMFGTELAANVVRIDWFMTSEGEMRELREKRFPG